MFTTHSRFHLNWGEATFPDGNPPPSLRDTGRPMSQKIYFFFLCRGLLRKRKFPFLPCPRLLSRLCLAFWAQPRSSTRPARTQRGLLRGSSEEGLFSICFLSPHPCGFVKLMQPLDAALMRQTNPPPPVHPFHPKDSSSAQQPTGGWCWTAA